MARWTDTTAYPLLLSPDGEDLVPIADMSQASGSRQRTVEWSRLTSLLSGAGVVSELAPSHLADETQGYRVGSLWFNTTADELLICTDATDGAAVWQVVVGASSVLPTADVGYIAGANGTTQDHDTLVYQGGAWVAGRPLRGKWQRPFAAWALTADDHDTLFYMDSHNMTFDGDLLTTGFSFSVFRPAGGSATTISRSSGASFSFVSVSGSSANTYTLPSGSLTHFTVVSGSVITAVTVSASAPSIVPVNSYAASRTLSSTVDLGSHARFTAAATVTIPPSLPVGWSCVIENATVSDTVSIAAGSGVTILSAGDEVANGKWVALLVVASNVVSAVGSFADEATGAGDVTGPASSVDDRIVTFNGTTGKLVQDGGVTVAELVKVTDPVSINAQTGTTYTLVLADLGKLVTLSNAAAITLTVPTNASVAFPVGTVIALQQLGAGAITVEGATGVTINGTTPGSETLTSGQYTTTASLTKHATDTWTLTGAVA